MWHLLWWDPRSNWDQFVQAEVCSEVFCRRNWTYFGFGPFTFYRGRHVLILTISMQTWRFLLKRVWSAGAPRIFAPAWTPQKPQIFGKGIFAVLLCNLNAKATKYCLIAPLPLDLTYLILSRTYNIFRKGNRKRRKKNISSSETSFSKGKYI